MGFLTSTDIEIISNQTDIFIEKFWRKVYMILHRNDVLLDKYHYEFRSELNTNYLASVVAIAIVTTSMAKATIAKISQLKSNIKSAGLKELFAIRDIIQGVGLERGVPRDDFKDQVQWNAILDKKTCLFCMSLHGAIFDYNDPNKPIPGDDIDVHPNCRCMYEYLPSILDIPTAAVLANLVRNTQNLIQEEHL